MSINNLCSVEAARPKLLGIVAFCWPITKLADEANVALMPRRIVSPTSRVPSVQVLSSRFANVARVKDFCPFTVCLQQGCWRRVANACEVVPALLNRSIFRNTPPDRNRSRWAFLSLWLSKSVARTKRHSFAFRKSTKGKLPGSDLIPLHEITSTCNWRLGCCNTD